MQKQNVSGQQTDEIGDSGMAELTRLEIAHKTWHGTIATLVSPPFRATPEELQAIQPRVDEATENFRIAFLENEEETIAFLSRNRLEVENFFYDLYQKFHTPEVYSCLYNYYARNHPSWQREQVEQALEQKCNIRK